MTVRDDEIISVIQKNIPAHAMAIDDFDRPFEEFGIDSFDIISLLLAVEKEYDFKISDSDVDALNTTSKIVIYVKAQLD